MNTLQKSLLTGIIIGLLAGGSARSAGLVNGIEIKTNSNHNKYNWVVPEAFLRLEDNNADDGNISDSFNSNLYFSDKAPSPLAAKVQCGGRKWVDGELLGINENGEIRTAIIDRKIYFKLDEKILNDKFSVLWSRQTGFQNNTENLNLLDKCVNNQDPSTYPTKYLGSATKNGIHCDNTLIKDKMLLGSYFEAPNGQGRRTDMYASFHEKSGVMRIAVQREGDANNSDKFNIGLMQPIINGENGSFLAPEIKHFSMEQIKGCFYQDLPKFVDEGYECLSDLSLIGLNKVSSNGLSFSFKGNDVSTIKWLITPKLNGMVVTSGVTEILSGTDQASITYQFLAPGDYVLSIQDAACASSDSSSIAFSVNSSEAGKGTSLNARIVSTGVELGWEANSEMSSAPFEIIRYDNAAQKMEIIGSVLPSNGGKNQYKFIDENPLPGLNSYQLNRVQNNTSEKSKIVSITSNFISGIIVSPNPATEYVDLAWHVLKSGKATLEIYNISGLKVWSQRVAISEGKNASRINVKSLPIGTYLIKISMDGQSAKSRFVKMD